VGPDGPELRSRTFLRFDPRPIAIIRRGRWILALLLSLTVLITASWKVGAVSGVVTDEAGHPLEGAVVRLRATDRFSRTGANGRFTLSGFDPTYRVRLTGWAAGYYIAGRTIWPWTREVALVLAPFTRSDNPSYSWTPPVILGRSFGDTLDITLRLAPTAWLARDTLFFDVAEELSLGCRDCHGEPIYDDWAGSAHARGFHNMRFASLYRGTDLIGQGHSPPTRYATDPEYGRIPLPPDESRPYFGPGYLLDFPDTAGNCAACHLPAAALAAPYDTDPLAVSGVNAQGAHCDFCHKIADVALNPATNLPYDNRPGVLSLVFMRPSPARQLFFGPYDDVDAGVDSFLPLQQESRFCAACHTFSFWGVPIYQSYAEWLASPYSDPETGQTCQDCHMRPDGVTTNFAAGRGGLERPPEEIFGHRFPGASDLALLQTAVTLSVDARRQGDTIEVSVSIANEGAGHHVPTDSPLRQLILLVEAVGPEGVPLTQREGPVVPEWGGRGDPAQGYFADLPGTAFAKLLVERWTEVSPTGAYWNPTRIMSDNRIPAFGRHTSYYVFAAPEASGASVRVRLLFRQAFIELRDQKDWIIPDLLMEQETVFVPSP